MGKRKRREWPLLAPGDTVLAVRLREGLAVVRVRYPGDSNYYVECRRLPPLPVLEDWAEKGRLFVIEERHS